MYRERISHKSVDRLMVSEIFYFAENFKFGFEFALFPSLPKPSIKHKKTITLFGMLIFFN